MISAAFSRLYPSERSYFSKDNEDPTVFYFYEQYESDEASQAHGATDHMKQLGADLKGVAGAAPEITRMTWIAGVDR